MTYFKMLTYYARNDRSEIAAPKEFKMDIQEISV